MLSEVKTETSPKIPFALGIAEESPQRPFWSEDL